MKLGQDCYLVRDADGHALACVYFEDEPGRRSAAHLMTRDEARRIMAKGDRQQHPLGGRDDLSQEQNPKDAPQLREGSIWLTLGRWLGLLTSRERLMPSWLRLNAWSVWMRPDDGFQAIVRAKCR
jgi:hypothetical protein